MTAMLALPLAGCIEPDDPALIAVARKTCSQLAKSQLQKLSNSPDLELAAVANVASDPEHNAFEFIWSEADIVGSLATEKKSVWCRGNAEAKIITQLSVSGDIVIASAQTY
ncbi:hypothetical protein [Methylobacterium sp.]|jgi:hypothetical protein|uniref:hypothetical protein n=1 Tax=Methylobacterium sp. TaxID=409 RepID=UPI0025EC7D45|nr:hypothetical protein [Methylobacterium sp.]MBY0256886.1 hypothetical protein [Methylobacterium sp.]